MSDSQGRFRVRRGELEIEYEGPGFMQEYKAALGYLGIVAGAQTRLEDMGFEAVPKQAVKHQAASHPPVTPAPFLSGVQTTTVASGHERSEFGIESQGHSLQYYQAPARQIVEVKPSQDMAFDVLGRANHSPEGETELQSPEPKKAPSPLSENKSDRPQGAFPSGMNDDKFKDVLRKLGLSL